MKKKIFIPVIIAVVLAILFVPIPSSSYDDGGTREYTALTYKIVDWNRTSADSVYDKTRLYIFPKNFKSIDYLWGYEEDEVEHSFDATILEISKNSVLVEPFDDEEERNSSDKISFGITNLQKLDVKVGDFVNITYKGGIMESYPAKINATSWKLSQDLREIEYTEKWLEKTEENNYKNNNLFADIKITKIYSNCFFAQTVVPMPYEIKLNGKLDDKWCVGDQVICTYKNTYYDSKSHRVECDFLTVKESDFELQEAVNYKPVIYLYPEEKTEVSVKLELDGGLTCTYPKYNDGWVVTAEPDGTLTDNKGQTYNYLYWEGKTYAQYDLTKGFCVKGEDTAKFLEDALKQVGLNRKEANEFIVYWLPLMQDNKYNIISFQTDIYTDAAKLTVTPNPDTLIRVFMAWQSSENYVELPEQHLTAPERNGFTVIEWGGTEIKR